MVDTKLTCCINVYNYAILSALAENCATINWIFMGKHNIRVKLGEVGGARGGGSRFDYEVHVGLIHIMSMPLIQQKRAFT